MIKTMISNIDEANIDKEEIKKHANLLAEGKTVIFPTETVYGLGANALDEDAVKKIYEAKGRPSDNPLIVHICDENEIDHLVTDVNEKARKLMKKFWPGPLTMIFNKKDIIPQRTSGGLDTVAIRMPSDPIAREVIKQSGVPIAAPSANISGRPSPTKGKHVCEEMSGRVSGIIVGGDCDFGLESTVVDMTSEKPMILRPGSVTKEQMEAIIGEVLVDPSIEGKADAKKAKAPGMKYTHYSPNGDVYIIRGAEEKVIEKINNLIEEKEKNGLKCGVMCINKHADLYKGYVIKLGDNLEEVAANLFDSLIEMDKKNIDVIYSEAFTTEGVGRAIMNRLMKSAGYKVINL